MAFFDDVGKKITQTGQGAALKAKNMAEIVKLNGMISDEEKRIKSIFLHIGQTYYNLFGENPDPKFAECINDINTSISNKEAYMEQIKQVKGITNCPNCNAEVPYSNPFCSSCGSSMNIVPPAIPGSTICSECGLTLTSDLSFCTNCGNKVEQAAPQVYTAQNAIPGGMQCSECGLTLTPDLLFCTNCGNKIEQAVPRTYTSKPAQPVEVTYVAKPEQSISPVQSSGVCAECGQELTENLAFCLLCGASTQ